MSYSYPTASLATPMPLVNCMFSQLHSMHIIAENGSEIKVVLLTWNSGETLYPSISDISRGKSH